MPFGKRKHGASGVGRPAAAERAGNTLAPLKSEYGTMIIGFVGNAKNGCCGGICDPGEGGVLQDVASTGDVGEEPDVQLDAALAVGIVEDFTICLELQ